jgi:hypothetical protein
MAHTSKLQDEIKEEKFELNKFHASKKDPFLLMSFFPDHYAC